MGTTCYNLFSMYQNLQEYQPHKPFYNTIFIFIEFRISHPIQLVKHFFAHFKV